MAKAVHSRDDVGVIKVTPELLKCDVMPPSSLGASEIDVWHQMLAGAPSLQRATLTPEFAIACERATGLAYVAVLHEQGNIRGFLPFEFTSLWHKRIRLANRIGGNLSDAAGIVAGADFSIDSTAIMRLAGLALLHMQRLMPGQERFGSDGEWSHRSYCTDITEGPDAYFINLLARNRDLVRDTERRMRKAEKNYGALSLQTIDHIPADALADLVETKGQQYRRTEVPNPFDRPATIRVIEALNDAPDVRCKVVLARLRAGGRTVAQHLGLQYNDVLSWWFPVYDPELPGLSPGRLLLWLIIQHSADDGIRLIDYGEGEAQYKRQFSTESIQLGQAIWNAGPVLSMPTRVWQSLEWRLTHWPRRAQNATPT